MDLIIDTLPPPSLERVSLKAIVRTLERDQSILVPKGKLKSIRSTCAQAKAALPDRRFLVRPVEGGVRIWRIA